jgi:t-SNARE syntaxin family protein
MESSLGLSAKELSSASASLHYSVSHDCLNHTSTTPPPPLVQHPPPYPLPWTRTLSSRSRRTQPLQNPLVASVPASAPASLTRSRDVLAALNTSRPLFQSYLRIRSSALSASSPELREARAELEQTLRDLRQDLEDLVDSVRAVEHDPYRFGLEIDEVERRRNLVRDVGDEVDKMHAALQQTVHDAPAGAALPDPDSFEDDDNYAQFEQERQMEMMHEQDEALDGVFRTVGNLRQQADDMGRELEEQGEMLDDVDTIADRVGGKLQTGMQKVGWVIRKNEDRWSSCCIAVLIFVLILLLVLLLIL